MEPWLVVRNGSEVAFGTGNRGWWYQIAMRWHLVRETVVGGTEWLSDGISYGECPSVVPNGYAVAFRTGNRGWWYQMPFLQAKKGQAYSSLPPFSS